MARMTRDPELREQLNKLAASWRVLAAELDKLDRVNRGSD
jgi:hypothetical protein